jgi:DNA-binding GntR family transcriptional regulator
MQTNAARIYEALAERIIHGRLLPGHKLDEQALADAFGVSRTPIREALRELSARGLVQTQPRRGAVVATIGLPRLSDMLEAECELEALCARLAAQRMSALEKSALLELHERTRPLAAKSDRSGYFAANTRFHAIICQGTHNATLVETISTLRERLAPFRRTQSDPIEQRLRRSWDEHGAIVAAIMSADAEQSYDAMRRHNARLAGGVIRLLEQRQQADAARANRRRAA